MRARPEISDDDDAPLLDLDTTMEPLTTAHVAPTGSRDVQPPEAASNIYGDANIRGLRRQEQPQSMERISQNVSDTVRTSSNQKATKQASFKQKQAPEAFLFPPDYTEVNFSDSERLERLERRPAFKDIIPQRLEQDVILPISKGVIPAPIAKWLRDYQIHGAHFLHKLFAQQRGGILGDDMGLGKTVQVIAFLTAAYGKTGDSRDGKRRRKIRSFTKQWFPRTLLVCPGVLIDNWIQELHRWGWWECGIFHGSTKSKDEALFAAKNGHVEILLTTYTTYMTHRNELNEVEWDCVIADEVHGIKGRKSQINEAMNEVNARCRIGLTGTAIQNNYDELWSLLNWANPGELGSSRLWKTSITDVLKMGQSHDATIMQLGKARKTATSLVQRLLPQFFLRRTKALIADQLPRKFDRVVFAPLTKTQAAAYTRFLDSNVVKYIKTASEGCDCGKDERRGWCCYICPPGFDVSWKALVFPALLMLSKLSNHVILASPNADDDEKRQRELELFKISMPEEHRFYINRPAMDNFTDLELCGKWRILRKLLAFWEPTGSKVLVFSHSTRLLEILRVLFTSTSYTVCYLDGKMTLEARAAEVVRFNNNPDQYIFCISTRAGGVGLNITSANKVVIVDPNWNPAYDLQAQDRAFRIGQTRDVEVYRLVAAGTIEEIIYARQIMKQQSAAIAYTASNERRHFKGAQGSDNRGEIFGLTNLFSYSESLRLKGILDNTDIAESRAGVSVASMTVEANEQVSGEDAVMSQFGKALSQGRAEMSDRNETLVQADPIQAILSQAGILYTHDNKDTLGTSRVESKLSAHARKKDIDFMQKMQKAFKDVRNMKDDYQYNAPEDVRRRLFKIMAENYGEDIEPFAVRVQNWSAAERREFLDDFYDGRGQFKARKRLKKSHNVVSD